jgi:hypothetical protein
VAIVPRQAEGFMIRSEIPTSSRREVRRVIP